MGGFKRQEINILWLEDDLPSDDTATEERAGRNQVTKAMSQLLNLEHLRSTELDLKDRYDFISDLT